MKYIKSRMVYMIAITFTLVMALSYSIFVVTTSKAPAANLMVSNLLYGISLFEEGSSTPLNTSSLTIPANTEKNLYVSIYNVSRIETKYALAYLGNVTVSVSNRSSWNPSGGTSEYENYTYGKTIKVKVKNTTSSSQLVEFSVYGGLSSNSYDNIVIPSGWTKITDVETETLTGTRTLGSIVSSDLNCPSNGTCLYGPESNNYLQISSQDSTLYRIVGIYNLNGTEAIKVTPITYTNVNNLSVLNNANLYQTNYFNCTSSDYLTISCGTSEYTNLGYLTSDEYAVTGSYLPSNNPVAYINTSTTVIGSGTSSNPYKIAYTAYFDYGTGSGSLLSKTIIDGEAYGELPVPTPPAGYAFSGWNGKNKFNYQDALKDGIATIVQLNGVDTLSWINTDTGNYYDILTDFEPQTQYTISGRVASNKANAAYIRFGYSDGTYNGSLTDFVPTANTFYDITNTSKPNATLVAIGGIWHSSERMYVDINTFQIEKGSARTAYEPYYVTSSTINNNSRDVILTAKYHDSEAPTLALSKITYKEGFDGWTFNNEYVDSDNILHVGDNGSSASSASHFININNEKYYFTFDLYSTVKCDGCTNNIGGAYGGTTYYDDNYNPTNGTPNNGIGNGWAEGGILNTWTPITVNRGYGSTKYTRITINTSDYYAKSPYMVKNFKVWGQLTNPFYLINISSSDNVGIYETKYALGNQNASYFTTGGELVTGNQITVNSNGTYTIFVRDAYGNSTVQTIVIDNIGHEGIYGAEIRNMINNVYYTCDGQTISSLARVDTSGGEGNFDNIRNLVNSCTYTKVNAATTGFATNNTWFSIVSSGSNTVPLTKNESNVWIDLYLRAGGGTTNMSVTNLKLNFLNGNSYTIADAVNNHYIEPLVIYSGGAHMNAALNISNTITGGSTNVCNYWEAQYAFKIRNISPLVSVSFDTNRAWSSAYDGVYIGEFSETTDFSLGNF